MLISIDDMRASGYCARGVKGWFDRRAADFRTFLHDGIEVETLLTIGDGHARKVVLERLQRDLRAFDLAGVRITTSPTDAGVLAEEARRAFAEVSEEAGEHGVSAARLMEVGGLGALWLVYLEVHSDG
ncbi:hypothetical protein I5E68_09895 [Novosphingobium sp. YJ-S2-02]|uniref:Uncharacterized protein n=1 Tax=Novosphingobium aureum TaxID=2792964 RepID=A0A931MKT2_9SPHN|nr:hypothetical protein [Novosphingobium aureum]MBH0113257.1 hypothetical protein [Novosphingobium aureum]